MFYGKGVKLVNFGERIKAIRTGATITQAHFAELCGISLASLKNYETGKTEIPTKVWRRIAHLFGTPLSNLVDPNTAEEEPAHLQALYQIGQMVRQTNGGDFSIQAQAAEIIERREAITFSPLDYELIEAMHHLNEKGQKTALERVRELGEIEKYRRE